LYALGDGSADEICEGLAGFLSLEFGVVCCESVEEVEGKIGDAVCGVKAGREVKQVAT